jgi:phenylpropionate dioxygenase-like ring-hydroxylating dioxygenase large terminal subunit
MPDERIDVSRASNGQDIGSLVENGRVHCRIYTDPAIFELEMQRIFYRTWVYIGHVSELPKPGDYRVRRIGRQPVILARGADEVVRVFMNRCRHRGSVVCEKESGRTKYFRCWFHGWVYDTSGKLVEVTGREAYGPDFKQEEMGLAQAPRFDDYRGFIFASLAPEGESLREFLGHAAEMIDFLTDASPIGEIAVDAGVSKTIYKGNWKLVGMDGYHPNFVHASVIDAWKRDSESSMGATHRDDPFDDKSLSRTRDLGNGHCMLDMREQRLKNFGAYEDFMRKIPGGEEYMRAMIARHGEQRGKLLIALAGDPHVGVFPNMQIINNQIRIINPISAGESEVLMYAVRLSGVSDPMNEARLRQHESFYGPAGAGSPDDAEIFERVQRGMMCDVAPWINLSRGLGRERIDADGTIVGLITDEVTQRAQARRWRELMTQPF